MQRELKTADEIQQAILSQVHQIPDVRAGKVKAVVSHPMDTDPHSAGCNWIVTISCDAGKEDRAAANTVREAASRIVDRFMQSWNLRV